MACWRVAGEEAGGWSSPCALAVEWVLPDFSKSHEGTMRTRGFHTYHRIEKVHYGAGSLAEIPGEVTRLGASRIFAVVSRTLRTKTSLIDELSALIGNQLADVFDEVPHIIREKQLSQLRAGLG